MTVLWRFLAPQGWRIMLSIALGAVVVGSNMGLLAVAGYLIAAASTTHLMALLIFPMYAVRFLSATRGSGRYAERMASHRVAFSILARLRVWLYDRIAFLGPAGMAGSHSADTLGRVLADVDELRDGYLLFFTPIAVAIAITVLLIVILFAFSSALAWSTLGYIVLSGAIVPALVLSAARDSGRLEVRARARWNAHLVDSIQGTRDILTNDAGSRHRERGRALSRIVARAQQRMSNIAAAREAAGEMLSNLAMLAALALAIPLVTSHRVSALYLAVPALLVLAGFEAIRPIGMAASSVGGVVAAGRRVMQLEGERRPAAASSGSRAVQPPYSLAFEHVTMRHGIDQRPALQDVSFSIPEGAHVAIVGPSGAGKSTLIHLLTRAWNAGEGRVLLGDYPVQEYCLQDLRNTLGVVGQDTYLFSASIRSNLRLARSNATESEMEQALDLVGLLDLISTLPAGLDTWVGEHGLHLSAGERQRLAVARMLLQDAPIILLDEITANLDPVSEADLVRKLEHATRGRTSLTVTHRLIGMDRMDRIVVLDRGRVLEQGTHAELVAACGRYRRLLDVQNNILPV